MVVLQTEELYDTCLPSRSSCHLEKPCSSDLRTRSVADNEGTGDDGRRSRNGQMVATPSSPSFSTWIASWP